MIGKLVLLRIVVAAVLVALVLLQVRSARLQRWRVVEAVFYSYVLSQLLFVVCLWFNHVPFPLHLEIMEGTVWQHARRAAAGLPVYSEPTPAFVALAYNPLFYYLGVPALAVLGDGVPALRVVAVLGMAASMVAVYVVVRGLTGLRWWGLLATGLFAGAYRAMDSYLDTAHADSWMLACALWGTILLWRSRTVAGDLSGVLVLVLGFWFKQHGALFAVGGVLWLTWRWGWRRAWPAWVLAALAGPALYLGAGTSLFGPAFHYFTWTVPSRWSDPSLAGVVRCGAYLLKWYPVLLFASIALLAFRWRTLRDVCGPWGVQFLVALGSALMGALDPGSSNNVFIPAGVWCIVLGTTALHRLAADGPVPALWRPELFAVAVTVGALLYDPRTVVTDRRASAEYADLLAVLGTLPGTVYAPAHGHLGPKVPLSPGVHWVALEDILRGPRATAADTADARAILASALRPAGPAWVLYNGILSGARAPVQELSKVYQLDRDFGDRFGSLQALGHRWDNGGPRYLYRYVGEVGGAAR